MRPSVDLSMRGPRGAFSLEKWYVDVLLSDGTVLLVYLGALWIASVRVARFSAELFFPDGRVVRSSRRVERIFGSADHLIFGPATISGELLTFSTPELSAELRYRPRAEPWTAGDPFLAAGARSLTWRVEVPDADVTGVLRGDFGVREISGRGYRDRVWFDLLPWRFPLRTLYWGRAVAGEHASSWVEAHLSDGTGRTALWGAAKPALAEGRVLLDADVLGLETLHLGALGRFLAKVGGDPHETKYASPAIFSGVRGVAIHEVVEWR